MALSKPSVAADPIVKREERAYTDEDVRKGLRYMLSRFEKGAEVPSAYSVAKLLTFPLCEKAVRFAPIGMHVTASPAPRSFAASPLPRA